MLTFSELGVDILVCYGNWHCGGMCVFIRSITKLWCLFLIPQPYILQCQRNSFADQLLRWLGIWNGERVLGLMFLRKVASPLWQCNFGGVCAQMHDNVRNQQRSKSANMKTLKSQMDLRTQGLGLNHPEKELFLNHKQFSVAELLTHFDKLT